MGVTRRIIFPVIRIVVLAAIAVALLKLAFSPDEEESAGEPLSPSAEITTPEVTVGRGTVANTVSVDATIAAIPPVPVKATVEGTVNVLLADPGDVLAAGDPVLEVVFEETGEPTTETDDEGNVTEVPGETKRRYRTIEAPVAGTLGEISVLAGQSVAIGDSVATVTTGGFTVTGTLTPEQQYRLVSAPKAAEITAEGGPAPFACTDLTIGRPATGGSGDTGTDTGDDTGGAATTTGSSTEVRCTVPAGVTVFDGLTATMAIEAGRAEDVIVVPVTAVEGSFGTGNVWVVLPDGTQEERPVTLGLTDGQFVEVTSGLVEGDTVLEFIPIANDEVDDGMMEEFPEEGIVEGAAG